MGAKAAKHYIKNNLLPETVDKYGVRAWRFSKTKWKNTSKSVQGLGLKQRVDLNEEQAGCTATLELVVSLFAIGIVCPTTT